LEKEVNFDNVDYIDTEYLMKLNMWQIHNIMKHLKITGISQVTKEEAVKKIQESHQGMILANTQVKEESEAITEQVNSSESAATTEDENNLEERVEKVEETLESMANKS